MELADKFSPLKPFKIFSVWLTRSIILLVVTGGVVRLTESGLGCADWPNCTRSSFIAPLKYHAVVEDANRFIVSIVSIIIVINFLWSLKLRQKFAIVTSSTILGLLISQIFMGAIVVYSHLYPPFVMAHFFLSILMVIAGVVQLHVATKVLKLNTGREADEYAAFQELDLHNLNLMSKLAIGLTLLVVIAGTAVTGAGPHSGSVGSKRLPVSYIKIALVHVGLVSLLFFCLITLVVYINKVGFQANTVRWGYFSIEALIAQAVIGLTQLIFHSPALVVGIHLFGACAVVSIVFEFYLKLSDQLKSARSLTKNIQDVQNVVNTN